MTDSLVINDKFRVELKVDKRDDGASLRAAGTVPSL